MAAVLRSGSRRLAGSALLGAPAASARIQGAPASGYSAVFQGSPAAVPLLQQAPPAGLGGLLLRPFLPRNITTDAKKVLISVEKAKVESMRKALEGKDIEMLRLSSDMRRYALRGSWGEVTVVGTRSKSIDLSTVPKTAQSVKESLKPGTSELGLLFPSLTFVGVAVFLLLNFSIDEPDAIMEKYKEHWGLFFAFITKFFRKKP